MSDRLNEYLRLEEMMLKARRNGNETEENSLCELMDKVYANLSREDIKFLNSRDMSGK